jgi:alkanesulfonate monooxygenase SsuD/methylene tetrahydromethanopterin reductase-like flavin-dependent oxidoreductase (luciferase family)
MRSGLWLPLFDDLAEPRACADLAVAAEDAGWDGVFVWDNLRWPAPVQAAGDPWITLSAIATATSRVRIGPVVTPLARRRPVRVARETVALDRLSGGRLVLGVGLGSDRFASEFVSTGEETDERRRAAMLDEALDIVTGAWSGEPVQHRGEHYVVDGISFLPRPLQTSGVPVWVAGTAGAARPMRRAARYDGFVPINLESPDQLAEAVGKVAELREEAGVGADRPYDVVVALPFDVDPTPYAEAGATWWLPELEPEDLSVPDIRAFIERGPWQSGLAAT